MRQIFLLLLLALFVWASNFSQGIRLFKQNRFQEAKHYLELAYEEDGIATAGYFLGLYYLRGLGDVKKDLQRAHEYLKTAADIGNVRAQCALAELYIEQKRLDLAKEILSRNNAYECQLLKKRLKKD